MTDAPDLQDLFAVLLEALTDADIVTVEERNALGEFDVSYINAPRLRADWGARADKYAELEAENERLRNALASIRNLETYGQRPWAKPTRISKIADEALAEID